jgi:hypothetical protein
VQENKTFQYPRDTTPRAGRTNRPPLNTTGEP